MEEVNTFLEIETNDSSFCHLLHHIPDPLSADAAEFRPAERHHIEPVIRGIVHNDCSIVQFLYSLERVVQMLCENRSVKSVVGLVSKLNCLIQR